MVTKQRVKDLIRACEEDFRKDVYNDETVDPEAVDAYLSDFVNVVIDVIDDNWPDNES